MDRGTVRGFNAVAKAELWDRWQRGESLKGDWTSVWQAVLVDLFSGGPLWWDSSCVASSFAGIDAFGARGDCPRHCGGPNDALDGQATRPQR